MDLTGLKRRELQALCKRHGLNAGGTNVSLIARLEAVLSAAAARTNVKEGVPSPVTADGTKEEEEEEEVYGGATSRKPKSCLRRRGRDATEAKKVTFATEERKAMRLRSRVIWSPAGPLKKTKKSAQVTVDSAAAAAKDISSASVLGRRSGRNWISAAEKVEEVAVDRKRRKCNDQDSDEVVVVPPQVRVPARLTRKSICAGAADVLPSRVTRRKSIMPVKDIKGASEKIQSANNEYLLKQPATKGPIRGGRRKSVVPALVHEKEKDLTAEKNRGLSMRKPLMPVKDTKAAGEGIRNARGGRRKSVVPELVHEKEKDLTAEKNRGLSMRKPLMPVKDTKAAGEGIQNARGKDLDKQFVVKQPLRRSSRKSVVPGRRLQSTTRGSICVRGEFHALRQNFLTRPILDASSPRAQPNIDLDDGDDFRMCGGSWNSLLNLLSGRHALTCKLLSSSCSNNLFVSTKLLSMYCISDGQSVFDEIQCSSMLFFDLELTQTRKHSSMRDSVIVKSQLSGFVAVI